MRILVAENDAPLAEFLNQRFQQEQFAVEVVGNGPEAQRLAANQSYDLVILDLNLPGSAGLDVLRGIRSLKPDLPVLMVTGAAPVEEMVSGLEAGADDVVAKPFAFAELLARIRAVLRRGNRSPRLFEHPRLATRPDLTLRPAPRPLHRSQSQGICSA